MGDSFNPNTYDDTFIADLVAFVAADEFQSMFESFFINFALEFTDDEEHSLRYTEIYTEFQTMFEEQLLIFCHQKNCTQEEFYRRCREISEKDDKTEHYVSILLSSCEYDTFVRLMKIMRPVAQMRLDQRAEAKGTASDSDDGEKGGGGAKGGSKSDRNYDDDDAGDKGSDDRGNPDAKGGGRGESK